MFDFPGARGRTRTGTGWEPQRILSPQRLPVPPPGRIQRLNYSTTPLAGKYSVTIPEKMDITKVDLFKASGTGKGEGSLRVTTGGGGKVL